LELIKTGKSNPSQKNTNGYTALIYACIYKLSDVVISLILTGESKPNQINNIDCTALNMGL